MLDKIAVLIATLGRIGFYTKAPGTLGSAFAAVISALINVNIFAIILIIILGTWASCRAEKILGANYNKAHDPGCIVIDEAVGVWLAVLYLPKSFIIPALVLFRIVDILKPWPVYLFERLPSGYGIMADDIAGGIIVNILLQAFIIYY
ncbi:MAG: phosphatidylglycerophosphatase A [Synergistaceae bacterium]|nr:phosphatidylglycerophosphatase A [Synergistaceae bacterium]